MSVDPTGRLVSLTRDAPSVAAITSRVRGGEKAPADAPPYVVVVPLGSVPFVGSPETRRTGTATWRHAFRCYGPKAQGGDRQAVALAGAVGESLHLARSVTFPVPGGGGTAAIFQILVETTGPVVLDPDTSEPFVVVTVVTMASAQAIA